MEVCLLPETAVRIPLHNKSGDIIAYYLVDVCDTDLALSIPWKLNSEGYAESTRRGRLHRIILGLKRGDPHVDHINGDTLDNRRANLRLADCAQNAQNRRGANRNSRSGIRGVHFRRDRKRSPWQAGLKLNGKHRRFGCYATREEAAEVIAAARARLMPYSAEARA